MDEVLALPTEKSVQIALRTQQLIAYETGVTNTIDPLGGSYFIEALTNKMEEEAEAYFKKIEELGGVLKAIDRGFFQQEIADAAYDFQRAVDSKKRIVVGVNEFVDKDEKIEIEILKIDPEIERTQVNNLQALRQSRDNIRVQETLNTLKSMANSSDNLIPYILDCVRAYATLGEIIQVFREEFGEYKEKPLF